MTTPSDQPRPGDAPQEPSDTSPDTSPGTPSGSAQGEGPESGPPPYTPAPEAPPYAPPYAPPPGQPQYGTPPGQPQYGAPPGGAVPLRPDQERTWGLFAHLSALAASFVAGLSFLGPLIIMLVMGDRSAFVRRHSVEALNFNLSVLIYAIVSAVLIIVLIGFVLLPLILIAWLVLTIMGAVKASAGEEFRYPLTIRFVK